MVAGVSWPGISMQRHGTSTARPGGLGARFLPRGRSLGRSGHALPWRRGIRPRQRRPQLRTPSSRRIGRRPSPRGRRTLRHRRRWTPTLPPRLGAMRPDLRRSDRSRRRRLAPPRRRPRGGRPTGVHLRMRPRRTRKAGRPSIRSRPTTSGSWRSRSAGPGGRATSRTRRSSRLADGERRRRAAADEPLEPDPPAADYEVSLSSEGLSTGGVGSTPNSPRSPIASLATPEAYHVDFERLEICSVEFSNHGGADSSANGAAATNGGASGASRTGARPAASGRGRPPWARQRPAFKADRGGNRHTPPWKAPRF